jgi:hypothetical protein
VNCEVLAFSISQSLHSFSIPSTGLYQRALFSLPSLSVFPSSVHSYYSSLTIYLDCIGSSSLSLDFNKSRRRAISILSVDLPYLGDRYLGKKKSSPGEKEKIWIGFKAPQKSAGIVAIIVGNTTTPSMNPPARFSAPAALDTIPHALHSSVRLPLPTSLTPHDREFGGTKLGSYVVMERREEKG